MRHCDIFQKYRSISIFLATAITIHYYLCDVQKLTKNIDWKEVISNYFLIENKIQVRLWYYYAFILSLYLLQLNFIVLRRFLLFPISKSPNFSLQNLFHSNEKLHSIFNWFGIDSKSIRDSTISRLCKRIQSNLLS